MAKLRFNEEYLTPTFENGKYEFGGAVKDYITDIMYHLKAEGNTEEECISNWKIKVEEHFKSLHG